MKWQDYITTDPNVCHGKACVKGTRVMVSVVLANLADGETVDQIVRGYHVAADDVMACLDYAAELANERIVDVPAKA